MHIYEKSALLHDISEVVMIKFIIPMIVMCIELLSILLNTNIVQGRFHRKTIKAKVF